MADIPPADVADQPIRIRPAGLVGGGLMLVGGILGLVGVVWSVQQYFAQTRAEVVDAASLLWTTLVLVAALGAALWLFAAALALQRIESMVETAREIRAAAAQQARSPSAEGTRAAAVAARNPEQERATAEMLAVLREVRDISLLNEAERKRRLEIQAQIHAERLNEEVPELLREHNWFEASKRVQMARERFPMLGDWDSLLRQIAAVRSQVEERDVEAAGRQIEELAALGAWERAEEVASDLLERHPDSTAARDLARKLRRQRNTAEAETRKKLMAAAQEFSNRRDWSEALATAKSLIQRFPKSPEAEALRLQLPTLEANAEIKTRQKMENELRDLINRRRFDEALTIAYALIERYPNSKQAEVLREQIPRLEEKAGQGA